MKSEIDKIYLIDRFLKGELSGPSLDQFKAKLRNDKDFAEEVESQRAIVEGIKLARMEQLRAILRGEKAPSPKILSDGIPPTEKVQSETMIGMNHSAPFEYQHKPSIKWHQWYLPAAAVLFTGFCLYFIFGYYIPHRKLQLAIEQGTLQVPANVDEGKTDEPATDLPKSQPAPEQIDSNKIENSGSEPEEGIAKAGDSIRVSKDKRLTETTYAVAAFETVRRGIDTNSQMAGNDPGANNIKAGVRQIKGASMKVEYWESVVNFKGYKLKGSNLKLFDVDPGETIQLKYLDKRLYMKRNGQYFRMNASGQFEPYQKELSEEVLKSLDNN